MVVPYDVGNGSFYFFTHNGAFTSNIIYLYNTDGNNGYLLSGTTLLIGRWYTMHAFWIYSKKGPLLWYPSVIVTSKNKSFDKNWLFVEKVSLFLRITVEVAVQGTGADITHQN